MAKYPIFVSGKCISKPSGKIKPIVKSIIPRMLTYKLKVVAPICADKFEAVIIKAMKNNKPKKLINKP